VFGYNFYIYIIYIDVKTCFYGPEMALVVNGTQALSAVAEARGRGRYLNVNVSEWLCAWSHVKDVRVFGESVLRLVNLRVYSGSIGHLWQLSLGCIS
jgi:hypothetical protein